MDEPALDNRSNFHASLLPILDREGAQSRIVIVKASFAIQLGQSLELAEEQREVRLGDELWGPPEIPDIRRPGDFCLAKLGTDCILSGHAIPAGSRTHSTFTDVSIRVAERLKVLRVHGPRVWRRGLLGVVPGASGPMEPTPLAWSRAYGGLDLSDPARPLEEARNPVGTGISRHVDRLVGTRAPQIEEPDAPIGSAGGRFEPVGCAPLGRSFEPRRKSAGTYDAKWLKHDYPARPRDYSEAHENCAPPDLFFHQGLRGGELIQVNGVHAGAALEFELPKVLVRVDAEIDGARIERRPHLDTVLIDSDAMVLELVWRALFRCPAKMRKRFVGVEVQSKEFIG